MSDLLNRSGSLLLTVKEAAEILRTTPKAVYTMMDRGHLPGVRQVRRRVLVVRAELLHWLDRTCAPSPQENRR
jgi:excisionase family DNA binding protein